MHRRSEKTGAGANVQFHQPRDRLCPDSRQRRGIDVQLIADLGQTEKIERNRISEIAAGGVRC